MAVETDGELLDLGPPKQRGVLALLAQHAGGTVSADRILDCVWGEERTPSAQSSLHATVSRLRRLLRTDASAPSPIVRRSHGYALDAGKDALDVTQFLADAQEAQRRIEAGDWPAAVAAAERALRLWRGGYLEDFGDEDWVRAAAVSLAEQRAGAIQSLIAGLLGVGEVAAALALCAGLVEENPLAERPAWLHMVALYRAGRTADALAAYQSLAVRLRDELGLEPGEALRELQLAVLRGDREMAQWPGSGSGPAPDSPASAGEFATSSEPDAPDDAAGIVGREQELATIHAVLAGARAGRTQWMVISGPPGIGKSRLADEAVRLWQQAGRPVARGQCPDLDAPPSWWPIRQVLRDLGDDADAVLAAAAEGDVDRSRVAVYERVSDRLRAHLAGKSLLIVVEDLHWADHASLSLLTMLAETFDAAGLLVAVTTRDASPSPELDRLLEAIARRRTSRHIELSALSRFDVGRLAQQISGETLADADVSDLAERTNGVPFFVVEYARLPAAERRSTGIPTAVRSVLRRRLAVLPDELLDVLRVAAVVGDPIDVTVLAGMLDRPADELADLLDDAADQALLVASATSNAYTFSHALLREELVSAVPVLRRQRLHLHAADYFDARVSAVAVVRRAGHLRAAGPAAEPKDALAAFRAAAEAAEQQRQYDVAATWWGAAVEAFDRAPDSTTSERDALVHAQVRNLAWAGRGQAVLDVLDAALVEALRAGRTGSVGHLAANLLRVSGAWPWPVYGSDPAPLLVTLRGLDGLLASDPAARARVLAVAAIGHCYDLDPAVPDRLSSTALEIAEQTGDSAVLADAILGRALTYAGVATHSQESIELLDRLSTLDYENAAPDTVLRHGLLTMATMNLAQPEACAHHVEAGAVAAELFRTPINRVQLRWAEASLAQWHGDLDRAADLYARAEAAHRATELQQAGTFELAAIVLAWDQGRLHEVSGEVPSNPFVSSWTSAVVDAAAGRPGADEALRAEVLRPEPNVWTSHGRLALLAHAVADRGLADLAQPLLDAMAPLSQYLATLGQIGTIGPVALAMARLADLKQDRAAAQAFLEIAIDISTASRGQASLRRCRQLAADWAARDGELRQQDEALP